MIKVSELLNLKNRVALVTGLSSGIGVGIAKRLHEAGANVVFIAIIIVQVQKLLPKNSKNVLILFKVMFKRDARAFMQ